MLTQHNLGFWRLFNLSLDRSRYTRVIGQELCFLVSLGYYLAENKIFFPKTFFENIFRPSEKKCLGFGRFSLTKFGKEFGQNLGFSRNAHIFGKLDFGIYFPKMCAKCWKPVFSI